MAIWQSKNISKIGYDYTIIDACASLWAIYWPDNGKVIDVVYLIKQYLKKFLSHTNTFYVFDRYMELSIKNTARNIRDENSNRVYQLNKFTVLPNQKDILNCTKNKIQLIDIITEELLMDKSFHIIACDKHNLVITGSETTPYEIIAGSYEVIKRSDLAIIHEEADVIIINQMLKLSLQEKNVVIVSDDADVFVLAVSFYNKMNLQNEILMESLKKDRKTVNITQTAAKYNDILKDLPAMHALSGCDSTGSYFGIGKPTALKVLQLGLSLDKVGGDDLNESRQQAKKFIMKCYGFENNCFNDARILAWGKKAANSLAPILCTLPPTDEGFEANFLRAHLQTSIWLSSRNSEPPVMNPINFGWKKDNNELVPIYTVNSDKLIPIEVMNILKCGCSSESACSTKRCKCIKTNSKCSLFCSCNKLYCANVPEEEHDDEQSYIDDL